MSEKKEKKVEKLELFQKIKIKFLKFDRDWFFHQKKFLIFVWNFFFGNEKKIWKSWKRGFFTTEIQKKIFFCIYEKQNFKN